MKFIEKKSPWQFESDEQTSEARHNNEVDHLLIEQLTKEQEMNQIKCYDLPS